MDARSPKPLSIGFVIVPDFTMLALAAFIDTLRLAADEGDRSRPIHCNWTVMSEDGNAVPASNGIRVQPDDALRDASLFDYVVVVGGTLHHGVQTGERLSRFLAEAAKRHIPLAGICTGSFILARAGLMAGRRSCVSWFHKSDFEIEFPELEVVADRLFLADHDRITCAGGTSVIHLASHLVERHLGEGSAAKGLRVMLEDRARASSSPQPLPAIEGLDRVNDPRVRRAMLIIERQLMSAELIERVASAVGVSVRQLNRLFDSELGQSPGEFREALRLDRALELVTATPLRFTEIAYRCGFADASHFSRRFKRRYGSTPIAHRKTSKRLPSRAR